MKQTTGILLLVFLVGLLPTNSVSALSCLDPASSIEYYVSEEQNTIFTAVAGNTVEHITQKASTDGDPNRQYNAGYVGQYVSVTDVHKGNVESEKWIYYSVNPTWGYMCTNQPPEVGTTNVYVVRNDNGNFDLPSVVQVFAVDSEYAKILLAALEESETAGNLQEKSAENLKEDLGGVLREMLTILRIKLAEWRFWTAQ
jgi:hypothetical protein